MLDQKKFKNNLIYGEYVQRNILNQIKIDSLEIEDFYEINKPKFIQPKTIIVNIYYFSNAINALENTNKIKDYLNKNQPDKTHDASIIKGLQNFKTNYKIDLDANDYYSEELLNEILTLKTSDISNRPMKFQNKFVLFYKKKQEGQCFKSLKNVYSQIEAQNENEKLDLKIPEIVKELEKKI